MKWITLIIIHVLNLYVDIYIPHDLTFRQNCVLGNLATTIVIVLKISDRVRRRRHIYGFKHSYVYLQTNQINSALLTYRKVRFGRLELRNYVEELLCCVAFKRSLCQCDIMCFLSVPLLRLKGLII